MGWTLGRVYRDASRAKQIINVFFKFGFEHVLEHSKMMSHVSLFSNFNKVDKKIPESLRFVMALEELGPTFIKLGQLLSTRPDIIPKDYFNALKALQDKVEPLSYSKIKPTIEREIGLTHFKHIEEKPIASASVSQVHRATLIDGTQVVIKVLKPDVEKTIESDLDLLDYFAHKLELHFQKAKVIRPVRIIEEFRRYTKNELDLTYEAQNAKRFLSQIGNLVVIPKVYDELCTKHVMVMDYIEGDKIKFSNNVKPCVKQLLDCFFTQIFEYGFFHADPHQGNILVTKNKKVALLDFGIVGHLTPKQKTELVNILIGVVDDESEKIVSSLLKIGFVSDDHINIDEFSLAIEDIIFKYKTNLKNVKIGNAFKEILEISNNFHVHPPKEFLLLAKCIITLEGVCLELDPDINLVSFAKPYAKKYFKSNIVPKDIKREFVKDLMSMKEAITVLPSK